MRFPSKRILSTIMSNTIKYLNQEEAIRVDQQLFNDYKLSVEQLMEVAGFSCACAIEKEYSNLKNEQKLIYIICGPGNNGGDGLVCARYLKCFGFNTSIYYDIPSKGLKPLYQQLVDQCKIMNLNISTCVPNDEESECQTGLIVDALFGFSFKPPVRESFRKPMDLLTTTKIPIVSIDIPSGWDVENGEPEQGGIKPDMLISLTAPKLCAKKFTGKHHYLGGRFVPPSLADSYKLNLPIFSPGEIVVKL